MRDVKNAKTDKRLSEKKLASVSAVSTDSDSNDRISLKTQKDLKNQYKKAEKIKHHYFRTFYYSFAITFIILGAAAIFYFMYQQDKNVFGLPINIMTRRLSASKKKNIPKPFSL